MMGAGQSERGGSAVRPAGEEKREGRGAAPSSVSMTVLCAESPARLPAAPLLGIVPDARAVFLLPLVLPALVLASAVVTVALVLPSVALGHWLGLRRGSGRRWWVAVATAAVLLPAAGLPWAAAAVYGRGGLPGLLLFATVLYALSLPAALAAHTTVLRADAGRPVRSTGWFLGYGAVASAVVLVGASVVLAASG